jgi:hypothetical protein
MTDIGCGRVNLGPYTDLADTIAFFSAEALPTSGSVARCDVGNSFTRRSVASERGWVAEHPLRTLDEPPPGCEEPNDTPLRCEIATIKPGVAIVMLGTNDLYAGVELPHYEGYLESIVHELLDAGVVPILSNIPHRTDNAWARARVGDYNAVVRAVAARNEIPLLNYWRALEGPGMRSEGMEPDGIHPNAHAYGASFTERGLQYGYNQRNLTALQALEKVRRIVFEDGPPD